MIKVWIMGVSKTSDHIQIKISMLNPSQKPQASYKTPNEDLKDMDVHCTFKTKKESKNQIVGVSKTSDHIKINIKMPNFSQELSGSEALSEDLMDMDVLCTFKSKIESQNLEHGCIKDQ